ncbi:MAG: uroporphyrinogen-III synthase [Jatrophihabitantaceae bacterium]
MVDALEDRGLDRGGRVRIGPLAGYTIGITAARRREEFGAALERHGGRIVYGPAIRIVPLADDTELLAATKRCVDAPLDFAVATTGIGFRGWLEAAGSWGLAAPLTQHLAGATLLARGPKARGAIRAAGLREAWSPDSESSAEVLEHLLEGPDLSGRRIAVQLHGDPLAEFVAALRARGADVIEVPVYRWVLPADVGPLRRLLESTAAAALDCVAFTSAPAATSFLHLADDQGIGAAVHAALRNEVVAACVGPVTAGPLVEAGLPTVQPERGRLGALVREIVEQVPRLRGRPALAAGHALDVRGHAVVVDGGLVALPSTGAGLLRELARQPGHVVSRARLLQLLPGDGVDGHAVDVAIGRLRTALGDPAIVQTVVKRGYRLAVAP